VLVGVDDVEPGLGEEAADRGDQAGTIGAGEQEAGAVGLAGDVGMMPGAPFVCLSLILLGGVSAPRRGPVPSGP